MRKIILFLSLFLCTGFLKAQLDTFNLSTYKLPDIKRHLLDFDLNFDGSYNSTDWNNTLNQDLNKKNNNINGDFGLGYNFYRNSNNYQGNQDYNFSFGSSYSDLKYDTTTNNSFNINGNLIINSTNRFYADNQFYIEADFNFVGNILSSEYDHDNFDSKNERQSINTSIPVGVGIGRIEQIQDAWLAIYILNELDKQGKLTRIPSYKEIIRFSEIISQLKNERFFDARLQKIKEIEEIDAYLQSIDIIDSPDSRYFTIVNDYWDNAAIQNRYSGKRFSFIITPEYKLNYNFNDNTNSSFERRRIDYNIMANLAYTCQKPISIKWQKYYYVSVGANYLKASDNNISYDSKDELESPQIQSRIYGGYGYYPNSRTDLNLMAGIIFINSFGTEEIDDVKNNINDLEINPYMSLTVHYYISPQLSLSAYYNLKYNYYESNSVFLSSISYNDYRTEKQFYQYLSVGFIYQIF